MAPAPPNRALTLEDVPGAPQWVEALLDGINRSARPTAAALDRGLTFPENFRGEVKEVSITPPEDWVPVTGAALGTGWSVSIGGTSPRLLSYRKTQDGTVQVRGRVDFPSGTPTGPSPVITFPNAGWLPDRRELFDCFAFDGAFAYTPATVSASPSGFVWDLGGHRNLSLSGDVWWTASDRTPARWPSPVEVRLGTTQTPFPGRPGYVLPLRARQANNPTAPVLVSGVDWEPITAERQRATGGLRLHRVWGLSPGVPYVVTLLVLPE